MQSTWFYNLCILHHQHSRSWISHFFEILSFLDLCSLLSTTNLRGEKENHQFGEKVPPCYSKHMRQKHTTAFDCILGNNVVVLKRTFIEDQKKSFKTKPCKCALLTNNSAYFLRALLIFLNTLKKIIQLTTTIYSIQCWATAFKVKNASTFAM